MDVEQFLHISWACRHQSADFPARAAAAAKQTNEVLTAVLVDREGFLNPAWVVGTRTWQGPTRYGPAIYPVKAAVAVAHTAGIEMSAFAFNNNGV